MPQRGIAYLRVGAAPLEPIPPPRFDPMPQRGIAYQPRVQTLGILPEKETRVLKERRISARVPDIAPGLLYAVFLQNTPILLDAVPRAMLWAGMRCPFSAANRRSRISARQGSLLPAGRVRWPRFPHLAPKPHPSRHGSESASSQPVPCQKNVRRGVRRRDRGQRPTATKDPDPKPLRRRRRRHCSRARRPRFPQLALRPHPSRQWLRIHFSASGPMPKRRSAPRPGSATHGYKRSESGTTAQAAKPPL